MRARISRVLLLGMVLLLTVGSAGLRPAPVRAQDDAARFADALAARGSAVSAAGPLSGELVQQIGFNTTAGAGVSLLEFSASATFTNPADANTAPFDVGISFRRSGDEVQQVVVDSVGAWYYTPYPAGTQASGFALGFNAGPGETNTLDLIVEGASALFGVNGGYVASFELPAGIAADVEVGAGYFAGSVVDGRAIAYNQLQVWSLTPGDAAAATIPPVATDVAPETATPELTPPPAGTPAATSTISATDSELFTSILATQAGVTPLAGPFTANLRETTGMVSLAWSGLSVSDFHASAVAVVPESDPLVAWDIGFMFGASPTGALRLVVDAQGQVFFSIGAGGPSIAGQAPDLRASPGESNTLDLLVAGQRAFFGVNGSLVATLDLPTDMTAADVGLGAGFYADQIMTDRLVAFSGFVVRPLAQSAFGPVTEPGALTPELIQQFDQLLAELNRVPPLAGPFSGRLVEATAGTVPLAPAGVALTDFAATATFENPDSTLGDLWDSGFRFRIDGEVNNRIVVDSLGDVYALLVGQDSRKVAAAPSYDDSPGGSNTLHLFVDGDLALFGVNGELVAAIPLPAAPTATDVLAGTGFFSEDFVVGRVTDYQDFAVWEMTQTA